MLGPLNLVLVLLAAAVLAVVACRLLKLPPLLGYLVVGILIGPHALALVPDREGVRYLAEFGVVFLMFSIGLEFSLPKLLTMRHLVFGLGFAQVAGAIGLSRSQRAGVCKLVGAAVWCWVVYSLCRRPPFWPRCCRKNCNSILRTAARSSAYCCFKIWRSCRF